MRAIAPSGAALQCRCSDRGQGPLLLAAKRRGPYCPHYQMLSQDSSEKHLESHGTSPKPASADFVTDGHIYLCVVREVVPPPDNEFVPVIVQVEVIGAIERPESYIWLAKSVGECCTTVGPKILIECTAQHVRSVMVVLIEAARLGFLVRIVHEQTLSMAIAQHPNVLSGNNQLRVLVLVVETRLPELHDFVEVVPFEPGRPD